MLALFPRVPKTYRPESLEKTFLIIPLSFNDSSPWNLREYPHKPCIARNYSHCAASFLTSIFIEIFAMGSKTHAFRNRVRNGRPRSSKVIDFGTSRKRACNFLLVISSNLGPILPRFRDYCRFSAKKCDPTLFHPNLGCSPWTRLLILWLRGAKTLS